MTETKNSSRFFYISAAALVLAAAALVIFLSLNNSGGFNEEFFILAFLIGCLAQMIDGALGMAYGVIVITFLMAHGIAPAIASGAIHISEIFTTGASGLSHWRAGNFNRKLFRSLIIPGIIGGVLGALLITSIDAAIVRPWVSGYLLVIGFYILIKAFRKISFHMIIKRRKIIPLALVGGFVDSVGGGGWGPVVTTTLLGSGHEPKKTIGSVSASEFFVNLVTGLSFTVLIGIPHWEIVAGLIIGGIIAAPIAAKITSKLPAKFLMSFVGVLIVCLSIVNFLR
ncbi:MAG: hypothetical protein A2887_01700 [Alphaproteobacteria bacterium RIFCSPLOWO2_01_FULL_40_26]|nr:MAG: hypothetical protein A3D15_01665 [Alphaproteobacteria bacterium RIFCSPHIGHO2_02_FULL_40_34]OFW86287.1 MAG: hypothetical protein A2794_02005 [Alphaproteobacteria bacterium RIFCSPHIGHO2_01_FULL_40_8]OFW94994.1 MAG: hypothetical protein A2887_01700 [Alphaproteobacteria bacterium RIFCSPLOWO2_01_FULL_40_26]OFX10558.1 MAG: hypothetical protein A3H30_02490 [Alphaproteobacteria bacterium RIFCSPLOWO2_02_FULL_40_19]OFX12077.1 MAG: hypothetical protein A3G22_03030 [Alphaproteobacteria bacterium RI